MKFRQIAFTITRIRGFIWGNDRTGFNKPPSFRSASLEAGFTDPKLV